jgi:hypothetical protein
MNLIISALIAFVCTFAAEVTWVLWIRRTATGKAMSSALLGAVLWLMGAGVILSYVEDKRMLIPAFIGSFIGGYITVKIDARKKKEQK